MSFEGTYLFGVCFNGKQRNTTNLGVPFPVLRQGLGSLLCEGATGVVSFVFGTFSVPKELDLADQLVETGQKP